MTEFRYFADPHTSTASMWSDEPSGGALLEQDQRSIYQFGCLVCHKPVLWYDFD